MPSIQLRDRDDEILKAVHEFRVLKSQDHIQRLFGGSDRIPRRLEQLAEHGFLYRFDRPDAYTQYYYGLGNQGATRLANEITWFPRTKVDWRLKNRRYKKLNFPHTFLVADIMISIELACRQIPGVRFITPEEIFTRENAPLSARNWYTKERFHATEKRFGITSRIKFPGQKADDATIFADWIFGLEFRGEKGKTKRYFFLEADRDSMPVDTPVFSRPSIVKKMRVYLQAGKGTRNVREATGEILGVRDSQFNELYNIPNIRTLFVIKPREETPGVKRIQTCIQTCKKITDGKGSKQFLFAPASWPESPTLLTDLLLDGTGSSMSLLPKVSKPVAS